ncbi:hypothetical protein Ato02nite_072410 [Paractinoplanes toevensis]|uniref:Uncharacterized protein n=1 Tax=Paractinoplanes toevensis TaxID=571911 RepID=A0A919W7L1_9ACTN|nr:hypothetical protein Ato02nite_072410 [Actinoplanes toevensis]
MLAMAANIQLIVLSAKPDIDASATVCANTVSEVGQLSYLSLATSKPVVDRMPGCQATGPSRVSQTTKSTTALTFTADDDGQVSGDKPVGSHQPPEAGPLPGLPGRTESARVICARSGCWVVRRRALSGD